MIQGITISFTSRASNGAKVTELEKKIELLEKTKTDEIEALQKRLADEISALKLSESQKQVSPLFIYPGFTNKSLKDRLELVLLNVQGKRITCTIV